MKKGTDLWWWTLQQLNHVCRSPGGQNKRRSSFKVWIFFQDLEMFIWVKSIDGVTSRWIGKNIFAFAWNTVVCLWKCQTNDSNNLLPRPDLDHVTRNENLGQFPFNVSFSPKSPFSALVPAADFKAKPTVQKEPNTTMFVKQRCFYPTFSP